MPTSFEHSRPETGAPTPRLTARRAFSRLSAWAMALWPAALTGTAMGLYGIWQRDPSGRSETLFLAAVTAPVLLLVGFSRIRDSRFPTWAAATGAACVVVTWAFHYGAHRGGLIGLFLTLLLAAGLYALAHEPPSFGRFVCWAGAWQILTHGEAVLAVHSPVLTQNPWLWLVGLPIAVAVIWRVGAAVLGKSPTFLMLCLFLAVGPTKPESAAVFGGAVALVSTGVWARRRLTVSSGPESVIRTLDSAGVKLIAICLLTLAALPSTYPWLRPDPWSDLWQAARGAPWTAAILAATLLLVPFFTRSRPFMWPAVLGFAALVMTGSPSSRVLIDQRAEHLIAGKRFRVEVPLDSKPVETLIVEADLIHGSGLEPGTEVLSFFIDQENHRTVLGPITSGPELGEWASGRPDLAAALGERAPTPWSHRVADDGTFFRQVFRSVVKAEKPATGYRLVVRRSDALPPDVIVRVHRLEVKP